MRYDIQLWATPLRTVKDCERAFDWPTEGDNFANWILVTAKNTGAQAADTSVVFHLQAKTQQRNARLARQLAPGAKADFVCHVPFAPPPGEVLTDDWNPIDRWNEPLARRLRESSR